MPNILETINTVVQSYIDEEPKPPLHVGEVTACWSYLSEVSESQVHTEAGINSTTDPELSKAFHEGLNMFKTQKERLIELLRLEGVPLPPLCESKPNSNPNEVPLGVKLSDDELANSLNIKLVMGITSCANAINQSTRNDVTLLWVEFLQEYLTFGGSMKPLIKRRGWLKYPPFYYPPGSPIQ